MKIKEYKCECGCEDFFFKVKGNQTGIYCSSCGKWLKWADKNERNLMNSDNTVENARDAERVHNSIDPKEFGYDPKKPFDFFGVEFPPKDEEAKVVDSTSDEAKVIQLQQALDRAKVLLKATYDLLQKQKDSAIVLNILATTAEWDGTECDGYCLQDDIDNWFLENFDEALSWDD